MVVPSWGLGLRAVTSKAPSTMNDSRHIRMLLCNDIEGVCKNLLPSGTVKSREWKVGSLNGEEGGSMGVCLSGDKAGVWQDFATGDKGDVFDLWMKVRGISFYEAFLEAKDYLGIREPKKEPARPKPTLQKDDNIKPMMGTKVFGYLTKDRKIEVEALKAYEVRSHYRKSPYNRFFMGFKFKDSKGDKVMFKSTGLEPTPKGKDIWTTEPYYTLWGWWLVPDNAREIIICEGEIDAMTVWQIQEEKSRIPVLSMPAGINNIGFIENDYDRLESFEAIYLLTDNDQLNKGVRAGEEGAKAMSKRLGPHRCHRIPLPHGIKDPNEALVKHGSFDLKAQMEKSYTFDPPTLRGVADCIDGAWLLIRKGKEQQRDNSFLFPEMDFSLRNGESTIFTGYKGHGKSEMIYQMHLNEMLMGHRVCIASLEIPPEQMVKNISQQLMGKMPTEKDKTKVKEWLDGKLWFYNKLGKIKDWKPMFEDFEYGCKRFGIDRFVVDSLHFVTKKEDHEAQDRFAEELDGFAKANDVHTILIAHARIKKGEHLLPVPEDVMGSSGIIVPFHNIISIWRNRDKSDNVSLAEETNNTDLLESSNEKHDGIFSCLCQRFNGSQFNKKLWFDHDSRSFRTRRDDLTPPIIFDETKEELVF